ncbi:hypothetical protein DB346_17890 [Verrucomicrobia bacterium LW23]|nr:hypothetical protein DB346_17890 [Verrucomicrobia bacterium LW23]
MNMILNPRTLFSIFATKVNNLWHHELHRIKRDLENLKAEAHFEETERMRLEGEAPICRPARAQRPEPAHSFKPFAHRHM